MGIYDIFKSNGISKFLKASTCLLCLVNLPTPAFADNIYEYATSWRLQNYVDNGSDLVIIWYTSASACTSGGLTLSGTQEQKDRFWSLILTAKAMNKPVGIFYTGCSIDSFYLDG